MCKVIVYWLTVVWLLKVHDLLHCMRDLKTFLEETVIKWVGVAVTTLQMLLKL